MKDPTRWVYKGKKMKGEHYSKKKHERERKEQGFSTYDWWGFNSYLAYVIIGGLTKFRDEGSGFPSQYESFDEWVIVLNKMIVGFEAGEELRDNYDENQSAALELLRDEAMALFVEHFDTLWD